MINVEQESDTHKAVIKMYIAMMNPDDHRLRQNKRECGSRLAPRLPASSMTRCSAGACCSANSAACTRTRLLPASAPARPTSSRSSGIIT